MTVLPKKKGHLPLAGDGPVDTSSEIVRLHHPLQAGTLLSTPTIDIGPSATATRAVQFEGIESGEIKTQFKTCGQGMGSEWVRRVWVHPDEFGIS
jgi:hypothetical protein